MLALEEAVAVISMSQCSWVKLFISIAKLNDRCFCYVTAAMFVSLWRTQTWRLHAISSINLGDTFLRIVREWKTAETSFLAKLFILLSSIISQILEFFYWMVTIFILITWLVKTENTCPGNCTIYEKFITLIKKKKVLMGVKRSTYL